MINNTVDKRMSFFFLLVLAGIALYLCFLIVRPFLTPILTATLLAVAIQPVFTYMLRFVRNRGVAAFLGTVLVLLALLVPAVFIVNTIANETRLLYGRLNEQTSTDAGWREYVSRVTDAPLGWIEARIGISRQQLRSAALTRLQDVSAWLLNWAKSVAINITGTILDTFVMLFTLFFLLRDGEAILERVGSILPMERERYLHLLKTVSDSIVANIYGVLSVSLAQALLGALGYWIAGLPNVMLWSVMTALLSIIPFAGAVVVWGAGVIYLAAAAQWGKAVFLLIYGTGVISLADNIVRPIVLSGRVRLNPLLVFFSLLGGVQAFGIIGLFVGPVVVSVAIALVKVLAEPR